MAKFKLKLKKLTEVDEIFNRKIQIALSHSVLLAKRLVNVETTSLKRSIRLTEPIRGKYMDFHQYVAGGTYYEEPLKPTYYSYFQEEIFKPYMNPSANNFIKFLKTKNKKAFLGTGEHIL